MNHSHIQSSASINDVLQSVKNQIQEAQRIAGGQGSEQDVAEAKIELEVGFIYCLWMFLLTIAGA